MIHRALTENQRRALKRTLIGTILATALLSAWGGQQNSSALSTKAVSRGVQKSSASAAAPQTNLRQIDPAEEYDPYEPPPPPSSPIHGVPGGIRYIVEAPFISQVPLRIVVGSGDYAELCLYNHVPEDQLCVTIDSPLPAGMDLEYTEAEVLDPDDDPRFLSFVPVNGNSDPEGWAASRFIDSLRKAAAVWGNLLASHPGLAAETNKAFQAKSDNNMLLTRKAQSPASNMLLTGKAQSPKSARPNRMASEGCYAEMEALGYCSNKPEEPDPNIPIVEVPGQIPRDEPPPYIPPTPELPPYEPIGGSSGGGGGGAPPIGQYPKDGLLAQATPVAPPCGRLGPGGLLCSIQIFGKRPPPLPPIDPEPVARGHQYFAPQILCDLHILCNEGQEPRDNDRGSNSGTRGKTQAELDQICVDINIAEIRVCNAIVKAKGRRGQDLYREVEMCKQEANDRMFACFETAKRLTDNGAHPAP